MVFKFSLLSWTMFTHVVQNTACHVSWVPAVQCYLPSPKQHEISKWKMLRAWKVLTVSLLPLSVCF